MASNRNLPTYSIAIRTLGQSGDLFKKELDSICDQTVKPENVFIYIPFGYKCPEYSRGIEEYVRVNKGMVSQRALAYNEIKSDYILFLDDDVELSEDSAEKMLVAATQFNADCVCADVFHDHELNTRSRIYNILVNMTFPIKSKKWGMKIGLHGALCYNGKPTKNFYLTQAGEGPAWMVRKKVWNSCDMAAEKWMDKMMFSYAEDQLQVFKIYSNGYKCGILYDSGITHLDAGTSSGKYKSDPKRLFYRSMAIYINWHRMFMFNNKRTAVFKLLSKAAFGIRCIVIQFAYVIAALKYKRVEILLYHFKGLYKGYQFTKSAEYNSLSDYIL